MKIGLVLEGGGMRMLLAYKMPLRNGKHCRSIWRNSTKICISQKKIVPLQAILIIS